MRRIAAMAAGVALLAGCGVELNPPEQHTAQTFTHAGGTLTIKSSLGGLRIEPGSPGVVKVDRWLMGKAAKEGNNSWSLRDGMLRLSANCTIVFGDCGGRYRIAVPPGVKLVVEGSDGVIATGLSQDVDIAAADRIRVVDMSGALRLRTEGPVSGERLRSPRVRARTDYGAIDLLFAVRPANVDALSRDGAVEATVPDGVYRVVAKSTDGSVSSQVKNGDSPDTITARSGSGNIRIRKA
ncbi:DUF4097 family beta strand repeat-containing protein [Nonomuraea typhae]|uniref:DUF4097 family beta strand repeat-containing protein n=1 Tax=Nonomuraea typhae TaxID=2603600 RepID=UPI0012FC2D6C|nr:DUF4097 family beta strand repeat-containing protein [Nonomuraea typhae]